MDLLISISLALSLATILYLFIIHFVMNEKINFCFKKKEGHQCRREVEKNHRGNYIWIQKKDKDMYISYFEWFSILNKFKKEGMIDKFYLLEYDFQFGLPMKTEELFFVFKDEESKKVAKKYIFDIIETNKREGREERIIACN